MTLRPILRWPDPRLSQVCAPVEDVAKVQDLVGDLFETMYAAPGRGLAAPQVGVMQRLFVMDPGWKDGDMQPLVCINPVVTPLDGETTTMAEACLSIPGLSTDIQRPARIRLVYTDLNGNAQSAELDGTAARIAQHEADHLDGIVTFTRLDATARTAAEAAYAAL